MPAMPPLRWRWARPTIPSFSPTVVSSALPPISTRPAAGMKGPRKWARQRDRAAWRCWRTAEICRVGRMSVDAGVDTAIDLATKSGAGCDEILRGAPDEQPHLRYRRRRRGPSRRFLWRPSGDRLRRAGGVCGRCDGLRRGQLSQGGRYSGLHPADRIRKSSRGRPRPRLFVSRPRAAVGVESARFRSRHGRSR